jgi:1-deoxy-D-xylulose 5-phosphate reductoisomerase
LQVLPSWETGSIGKRQLKVTEQDTAPIKVTVMALTSEAADDPNIDSTHTPADLTPMVHNCLQAPVA